MWKFLYQLASPKACYQIIATWHKWIGFGALIFLSIGLIWGLVFAPSDYLQGDAFRIIYVHVPSAFLSLIIYLFMGFMALLLLIWRLKMAGIMLKILAQLGALLAFLALFTGSIWGKPMWGTW